MIKFPVHLFQNILSVMTREIHYSFLHALILLSSHFALEIILKILLHYFITSTTREKPALQAVFRSAFGLLQSQSYSVSLVLLHF